MTQKTTYAFMGMLVRHQIEDEIPLAGTELAVLKTNNLTADYIAAQARDLDTRWPKMTVEERRRIAEALVRRITVGKGEIDLNLYCHPGYAEMTNKQRLPLYASR